MPLDHDFDDVVFDHKNFDDNDFADSNLTNYYYYYNVMAMFRERVFVQQKLCTFYILLVVCGLSMHIFVNIGSTH